MDNNIIIDVFVFVFVSVMFILVGMQFRCSQKYLKISYYKYIQEVCDFRIVQNHNPV